MDIFYLLVRDVIAKNVQRSQRTTVFHFCWVCVSTWIICSKVTDGHSWARTKTWYYPIIWPIDTNNVLDQLWKTIETNGHVLVISLQYTEDICENKKSTERIEWGGNNKHTSQFFLEGNYVPLSFDESEVGLEGLSAGNVSQFVIYGDRSGGGHFSPVKSAMRFRKWPLYAVTP